MKMLFNAGVPIYLAISWRIPPPYIATYSPSSNLYDTSMNCMDLNAF